MNALTGDIKHFSFYSYENMVTFYEKVGEAIENCNKDGLETELQFNVVVRPNGYVVYTAGIIGRERIIHIPEEVLCDGYEI